MKVLLYQVNGYYQKQLNLNQDNISSFDIVATTLVDGTTIGVKVDDSMYSVTTQAKTYSNFIGVLTL